MVYFGPEEHEQCVGGEKQQSWEVQQHILQRIRLDVLHLQDRTRTTPIQDKSAMTFPLACAWERENFGRPKDVLQQRLVMLHHISRLPAVKSQVRMH